MCLISLMCVDNHVHGFHRNSSTITERVLDWLCCNELGMQEVPSQLAVPWCALSDLVGLPPVMTLSTTSLSNYRIVDKHRYRIIIIVLITPCNPQRIKIRGVRWSLYVCSHCLRELGSTKRFNSPAPFGPWPKIDWHFGRKPRNQLPVSEICTSHGTAL